MYVCRYVYAHALEAGAPTVSMGLATDLMHRDKKGKAVSLQAWTGPEGSRKLWFPDFMATAEDAGRLSLLRTDRLYPQEILLVLISVRG